MTDNSSQHEEVKPSIKWVKSPDGVFETYANQTHLNWSLDDVRIRFAQIMESGENTGPRDIFSPVNLERAVITMSWRNAKVLRNQLERIIANHEKVNGEINLQVTLASNEGT